MVWDRVKLVCDDVKNLAGFLSHTNSETTTGQGQKKKFENMLTQN